jgi:hypothetical protein
MTPGTDLTEEWYIVFTTSKLTHWIFRWLNPCFQHCYMVREDNGLWLIVDSKASHTEVRTELVDDYPHIRVLCPNSVILPVTVKISSEQYKWHIGINSCVDVCKGIMGIDNWRIFTPYQLYRCLNG